MSTLDRQPAEPAERAALVGRFVRLEPLDPARHAAGLYATGHGSRAAERLWDYLPYGPFKDPSALRDWLEAQAQSRDPLFYACISNETDKPLGMLSFLNIVTAMRTIEIGHIWFGPEAQRNTANTEACHLMISAAVERWRYRRVEWKCNAQNRRSRLAAARLGFSFEGVFRQHLIVKGVNRDTAWFGLTDQDWPAVKACHEAWLYGKGERGSLSAATAPLLKDRIVDRDWS
ncbi:MAG: GNAT family protein [Rhodospirillales bacterium]